MKKNILLIILITFIVFITVLHLNYNDVTNMLRTNIVNEKLPHNNDRVNKFNTSDNKKILQFNDGKKFFYYKNDRIIKTNDGKAVVQLPLSKIYKSIKIKDHFIFKTRTGNEFYVIIADLGEGNMDFYVLNNEGEDVLDPDKIDKEILSILLNFYDSKNISKENIIQLLKKLDKENVFQ